MKNILLAIAATWALTTQVCYGREALDKPNIVVIYLDDAGYGDFSHTGNPTINTPNITELAYGGVNFTQFYVSSPACSASRYSLMTGRVPGRSGLNDWVVGPYSKEHISTREITLAEGLKTAGYATALFGKWHLGNPNKHNNMTPDSLPLAHGFDDWIGTNVSHDYDTAKLLESDEKANDPVAGYRTIAKNLLSHKTVCESLTKRYTDAAISFIKDKKEQPFFAYVAYNMPHLGLYVSDGFRGKSRRGLLGDVQEEVDHAIGRIVASLEEQGIAENTIIFLSSDNGPWLRFKNTAKHDKYGEPRMHVGNAYPFRDGKGSTWEGGVRVPGIFYWPGVVTPQIERAPASTLDVLPTIFSIAGIDLPADRSFDGRNIAGYLSPDNFKTEVEPFRFVYSDAENSISAVRKGPWKLHVKLCSQLNDNYGFEASREKPLLFNVEQDLGERFDRAAEHPEIVEDLLNFLKSMDKQIHNEKYL